MRVLQVCQPSDGGVARQVLVLSSELRARGWSVGVACSPGALADELRGRNFEVRTLPLAREISPRKDIIATLRLWNMIRRGGYSLVHTHSAKGGVVGRVAAWAARTPALYTPHAWSFLVSSKPLQRRFYTVVEQALTVVSNRIICVSTGELELGLRSLKRSEKKLRLVPNGIAVPPRVHSESENGELVIGTIARLARQKGIGYLIQAASAVCAERSDVRFEVAGDGPDLRPLQAEVTRRGLDNRFKLMGSVEDPWRCLGQIDVFVLPSLWEGMPFALLEAMGFGLPVVATDVGGVRDLVPDETVGIVVPPADPDALAEAILRYVDSASLRKATGEAARERVLKEFTQERMVERTLEIYSEVLS